MKAKVSAFALRRGKTVARCLEEIKRPSVGPSLASQVLFAATVQHINQVYFILTPPELTSSFLSVASVFLAVVKVVLLFIILVLTACL